GPGSLGWRIDREVVVLAGATAAFLLQLADPAVAAGVAQHSNFREDPYGRLQRTLISTFSVAFGSTDRAEGAIEHLNAIHRSISGTVPESGADYEALDPVLLLWVHATLIDTALRVYDRYVEPLTDTEMDAYLRESRPVAVRLGVPESLFPDTVTELRAWMAERIARGAVRVTPTARSLSGSVLYPSRFPPRFVWTAAHLISFSILPPEILRAYGIRWGARRGQAMYRVATVTRSVLPLVPAPLRYVPAWRGARRRLMAGSAGRR
ncbi:MAG TPA: oxygenase MpaB family protein, partial [bacterium]